jgi:hypothetical protein
VKTGSMVSEGESPQSLGFTESDGDQVVFLCGGPIWIFSWENL